jgi:hypothetical protein
MGLTLGLAILTVLGRTTTSPYNQLAQPLTLEQSLRLTVLRPAQLSINLAYQMGLTALNGMGVLLILEPVSM